MIMRVCKSCKRLLPRAASFGKYASGGRLHYKAVCHDCVASADERRLAARRARCVQPPDMRDVRHPLEAVTRQWVRG